MTRILFVCHGNICRSPMAEFMFKDLVKRRGREDDFHIESAAVSSEELGNPVYPQARRILASHGISCSGKTARQVKASDYDNFDLIIAMDRSNMRWLGRILPSMDKCHLLLSFAGEDRDVSDPWYTDDFETCWNDISLGLEALATGLGL